MRWIVVLSGGSGPDVWVNEEMEVEGENIKEAVDAAIEQVNGVEDLSIHNIVGIDLN